MLHALSGFAQAATGAVFLFLIDGALGLRGWGSTLLLLQTAVALVTTPVWSKLGAKIDRKALLALSYGWQLATAPLVLLLPVGNLAPAIALLILRGLLGGVDFLALRAMVADIARDSATAGLRCGASCHSVCNITLRLAMGAGVWFALSLLSMSSGGLIVRAAYVLPSILAGALGLLILAGGRAARAEGRAQLAPTTP